MTYRSTFGSATGLYAVGGLAAGLLLAVGVASPVGRVGALLVAGIVVALLVAVHLRYLVSVTPDELHSRSLVRDVRMRWQEIARIRPGRGADKWTSSFVGPYVLEFASPTDRLRINFKMFPRRCREDVLAHVPAGVKVPE